MHKIFKGKDRKAFTFQMMKALTVTNIFLARFKYMYELEYTVFLSEILIHLFELFFFFFMHFFSFCLLAIATENIEINLLESILLILTLVSAKFTIET